MFVDLQEAEMRPPGALDISFVESGSGDFIPFGKLPEEICPAPRFTEPEMMRKN